MCVYAMMYVHVRYVCVCLDITKQWACNMGVLCVVVRQPLRGLACVRKIIHSSEVRLLIMITA